ncbi:Rv3235 family protein [Amycolatopsis sp. YIM 10]|uniref:Rv3235 family protein n=1 Tax=Amycolatopsis sp. YIM 10 TaxID=2653857 RepID=UPI00129000DA|nr:Rv3235 family protein [Amycolatopsis sp. YIM 10]
MDLRPLNAPEAARHLHAVPAQLELPIFTGGGGTGRARPGPPVPGRRTLERMVTAILELCCGRRARAQLRPLLRPDVYAKLTAVITPRYALVNSVQACFPHAGVIEACATVSGGTRPIAVAARFEATPDGWWCVAFDLIGVPDTRNQPRHVG